MVVVRSTLPGFKSRLECGRVGVGGHLMELQVRLTWVQQVMLFERLVCIHCWAALMCHPGWLTGWLSCEGLRRRCDTGSGAHILWHQWDYVLALDQLPNKDTRIQIARN